MVFLSVQGNVVLNEIHVNPQYPLPEHLSITYYSSLLNKEWNESVVQKK